MTSDDVAQLIASFLDGSAGKWDWDDFISVRQRDPTLEAIRLECAALPDLFPPDKEGRYCGAAGLTRLAVIASALKAGSG